MNDEYKGWKKDPKYVKFMKSFFEEHPVLDIGCGDDKLGDVGVDADIKFNPDITHNLNVFPYPFRDSSFPTVNMHHVLEHLEDPENALKEIERILKPNGKLILTVPHPSHKNIGTIYTCENHTQHFTEKSIIDLVGKMFKIGKVIKWKGTEKMPFPIFIHKILGRIFPSQIIVIARKK
jgi:ubiquinone/menaquinone biosynthesis C-methylase UbiE